MSIHPKTVKHNPSKTRLTQQCFDVGRPSCDHTPAATKHGPCFYEGGCPRMIDYPHLRCASLYHSLQIRLLPMSARPHHGKDAEKENTVRIRISTFENCACEATCSMYELYVNTFRHPLGRGHLVTALGGSCVHQTAMACLCVNTIRRRIPVKRNESAMFSSPQMGCRILYVPACTVDHRNAINRDRD